MRLREIIVSEAKDYAAQKGMKGDWKGSIPNSHIWPELDNSSGYLAYRFGLACAGMPDKKMDVAGPTGLKMVTIGYTPADQEILDAAANLVGTPKVKLTSNGSKELSDTYTRSPVNDWNKSDEKEKVKEGVMQTGDPGMGTPEANKAGWGSGNYTSQRPGSWNGTAECMGDDLDQQWSKKMKLLKKVNQHNKNVKENITSGASGITSSGNVASLGMNPALSPGPARGKKSYTGTQGHSGTKAPPQPKVKQPKTANGTAKNGLDMKGSIFGQPIKR